MPTLYLRGLARPQDITEAQEEADSDEYSVQSHAWFFAERQEKGDDIPEGDDLPELAVKELENAPEVQQKQLQEVQKQQQPQQQKSLQAGDEQPAPAVTAATEEVITAGPAAQPAPAETAATEEVITGAASVSSDGSMWEIITEGAAAAQKADSAESSVQCPVHSTTLWDPPLDRQIAMLRDADLGAMGFSTQVSPQEKQ